MEYFLAVYILFGLFNIQLLSRKGAENGVSIGKYAGHDRENRNFGNTVTEAVLLK
jgi:hypothetical protein